MGVRHAGIIEQVIREAPSVAAGAKLLGAIARLDVPPELPVWKVVDALRWEQDVAIVRDAWVQRARSSIPTDASGVYFAINGLNMPDGRGVELNCSSGHLPGWQAIDFIFNCEITCDDIPLPSLSRLYTWLYADGGYETFGSVENLHLECPICLGVTALVFRDALRKLDPFTLAGETVERCYAIGFHDGDVMRLGRGTQEGYANEPTFDCW
jgi:hypothetical protein